mmetsp:Transcript_35820/g.93991  ORF Transcript_35820/g.93991 Transcript_35820/m.93991 type:complete len:158 (+) Transcript_35820:1239-1712(+)
MCLQFETLETSHHHGLQEHPVSSRAGAMASGEAIIRGNGLEPNGALTDRDGRQRDHLVASRSGSGAAVVDGRSQQEVDISRSTSGTEADRRDWMARRPPEIWPPPELREVVQVRCSQSLGARLWKRFFNSERPCRMTFYAFACFQSGQLGFVDHVST